jgi:hypothetical protein
MVSHIAVIGALGPRGDRISHASNRSPCADAAAQPDDGAPQVLTDPTARPPRRGGADHRERLKNG